LGVFGIALASASLPVMSRQAAAQDHRALAATLSFALRLALYVSVPATVGLVVLRTPIVRLLFERGRFGPVEPAATAEALRRLGRLGGRALVSSACRTTLASLPLAGSCWLALALWPSRRSLALDIAWLAAAIVVGVALFWGASVALGISERSALLNLFRRREHHGTVDA